MTDILKFTEAQPTTYPTLKVLDGEGAEQDTFKPDPHLWARIEAYTCKRWTPRLCTWVVQGPGSFEPHLSPLSAVTVFLWDAESATWVSAIADASPVDGFVLPAGNTYKVSGLVGADAGDVPQPVVEAYQRLADYAAERHAKAAPAGSASYALKLGEGGIDESIDRSPNWLARALQYSGAADLLRPFRMV